MSIRQNWKSKRRMFSISVVLFMVCLLHAAASWAWTSDPLENISVFPNITSALTPQLVSDGWNGAIIISGSNDGPLSTGNHTQRIDANGSAHAGWPANGVIQGTSGQENSRIMSDGAGGAYIVWEDYRNDPVNQTADIFVQRIDANGGIHNGWPAGGLAVSTATNDQALPRIISDGAGGAIIVWEDLRSGVTYDIYAQRIDATGGIHAGWTVNGVPVSVAVTPADKLNPHLVSDGAGGAFIVWEDFRNGNWDLFAQRINASGATLWPAEVAISTAPNDQFNPELVSDGAGGVIIVWEDYRNDPANLQANIFAQRLDATGSIPNPPGSWIADGMQVAVATTDQQNPQIVSDGAGGAVIVWQDDNGTGTTYQIYGQRLAPDGSVSASGGVAVSRSAGGNQQDPQLISDGANGAIVVWEDYRNDPVNLLLSNIFAQRVNATLVPLAADVAVSTALADQDNPQLVSDGTGGAIIAWQDFRNNTTYQVFAQRINSDGTLSQFATPSLDVTPAAGANGTITPAAVQTVNSGATVGFTITANTGFAIASVTGCGGTLTGSTFTTGAVTANCTVSATFSSTAGPDGIVNPAPGKTRPDVSDALRILQIAVGLITPPTANDLIHGDVALPAGIDVADALVIMRMAAGLI